MIRQTKNDDYVPEKGFNHEKKCNNFAESELLFSPGTSVICAPMILTLHMSLKLEMVCVNRRKMCFKRKPSTY